MVTVKNKTILLVEDEAILAMSATSTIEKFGYNVLTALDGNEAIRIATNGSGIDLVLMDIDLGEGIDGTESARRILEKKNLPIVFLTSHSEREMVERVRGITRYGYIIKNSGNFVLQSSIEMAFDLFEAHEKMRESEARQRTLFQAIPDIVWLKDENGIFLSCNHKMEEFLGRDESDIVGKTDFDLFDRKPAMFCKEFDRKVMESGKPSISEEWLSYADEKHGLLVETIKTPVYGDDGQIIGVLGIARDITERKKHEEELQKRELEFRNLLENSPDHIARRDLEGRLIYCNYSLEKLYNRPMSDLIGTKITDRYPDDHLKQKYHETVLNVVRTGKPAWMEVPFENHSDASEIWTHIHIVPEKDINSNVVSVMCIGRDITERKRTEEELQKREREFRNIAEQSPDNIVRRDKEGRLIYCNQVVQKLYGKSLTELMGTTVTDLYPGDQKFREYHQMILDVGMNGQAKEIVFEFNDTLGPGKVRHQVSLIPEKDINGEVVSMLVIGRDVNKFKNPERRLRTLIENIPDIIIRFDKNLRISYANSVALSAFNYLEEEITGKLLTEIFPLKNGHGILIEKIVTQSIEDGRPGSCELQLDFPDGNRTFYVRFVPELTEQGTVIDLLCIAQDISERKRIEDALSESETKYRNLVELSLSGVYIIQDGLLKFVNKQFCDIFGFTQEEIVDKMGPLDLVHPDDKSLYEDNAGKKLSGEEDSTVYEIRSIRKDGTVIFIKIFSNNMMYRGSPAIMGTVIDMSDQKRNEEALRKRVLALSQPLDDPEHIDFADLFNIEELQRIQDEFADAMGVASLITKPDGTPITRPSNFCRLCNDIIRKTEKGSVDCMKSDAYVGRYNPEGPNIQPCMNIGLMDAAANIIVDGRHIATWGIGQIKTREIDKGSLLQYADEIGADRDEFLKALSEVTSMPQERFEKISYLLYNFANELSLIAYQNVQQARFITKIEKAQKELIDSKERLQLALEGAEMGLWENNIPSGENIINERGAQMLGYTIDELKPSFETWKDHLHPDDLPRTMKSLNAHLEGKKPIYESEFRMRTKEGHWKWILARGKVLERDEQGRPIRMVGTNLDIDERKKTEEALHESEYKYRNLTDLSLTGVYIVQDGYFRFVNKKYCDMIGYTQDDIIDKSSPLDHAHPDDRKTVEENIKKHETGEIDSLEFETRLIRKDGNIIHVKILGGKMIYQGKPAIMSTIVDITVQKRTEEALRKKVLALSQPLDNPEGINFSDLFDIKDIQRIQDEFAEATGVGSIITNPDGIPITRPSNFCRICSEIIRKTEKGLANCIRSDSIIGRENPDKPIIQPCLSGGLWDAGASITVGGKHLANWLIGQVRNDELDMDKMLSYADEIGADREEFRKALEEVPVMPRERFEKVAYALKSMANELSFKAYHNVQQARFITGIEIAQKELIDSKERLQLALDGAELGLWDWNMNTGEVIFNERWTDMLGYRIDELNPRHETWENLLHPDDIPGVMEILNMHLEGKIPFYEVEFRLRTKEGNWKWISARGKVLERDEQGRPLRMAGTHLDIHERKKAEEELIHSSRRLKMALQSSMMGTWDWDVKANKVIWSDELLDIFQISPDEFEGTYESYLNFVPPEARDDTDKFVNDFLSNPPDSGIINYEHPIITGKGVHKWIEIRGALFSDGTGNLALITGVCADITERKQFEETLRKNEEKLQLILQTTMDGYHILDMQARFLDANKSFCEMIQYTREELINMSVPDIDVNDSIDTVAERFRELVNNVSGTITTRLRRKDGEVLDVEISANYLPLNGGRIFCFTRDITERKLSEERIQSLLKEKELLLREVHHRIKNNMTTMQNLLALQAMNVNNDDSCRKSLEMAKNRMTSMMILYNMLYKNEYVNDISLKEYIESLADEISLTYPIRVAIEKNIDDIKVSINIASTLGIIVNELISNSMKYAFKEGNENIIDITTSVRDNHITLIIRDNGIGINPDLNHQGFGLSLVQALVEQLGGSFKIESHEGTSCYLDFNIA